jgi:hypothetical protein
VPSRARFFLDLGVGCELAVDGIRQAAPQAAHCFHGGFPGGELAPVVGAACSVVAELDDPGDVKDMVEAAVPGAGEPVADVLAAGSIDGGGAGPGREVVPVGEPGDVSDVSEDPGRAAERLKARHLASCTLRPEMPS